MIHEIIQASIPKGISYETYVELINQLVAEGKTTGEEQTEEQINVTKLNASRMRRLDKTLVIPKQAIRAFQNIKEKQTWLVLMESWCADGAQTIPILNKICNERPNIDLKILLRDENRELMDHFLTNGTRSMPKLILLDSEHNVLNTWGPRSRMATNMVAAYKSQNGKIDDSFKKFLQIWYNKDKGEAIIKDLVEMIENAMALKQNRLSMGK